MALAPLAFAQAPMHLTLTDAERLAVKNNPALAAAQYSAQAVAQTPIEARSALFPTATGSVTGVGADAGSRLAAGALNNPVVYNRLGTGVTVNQLITDFGRTRDLVDSAKYQAQAENQNVQNVDAQVLLETDRAYFAVMRAQSVLTVARQTVDARQLVADQVAELARSNLKSQLDASFANVNLAQAKIQLSAARNEVSAAKARLATALGMPGQVDFDLANEGAPPAVSPAVDGYIQDALRQRPDVAALRLRVNAADKTAQAERALSYPTVSAIGAAGFAPAGDPQVPGRYGAAGVNLNVPIFNGGLFRARRTEAELRLAEIQKSELDLENRITRDVRTAWLDAQTAYEQVGLTVQLLDQSKLALDLAQGRYDLGLGSIVELSQAQLNYTAAEIGNASAMYDYSSQYSFLRYQTGSLR
jgi:outer membrane protein